jgi:transposase
MPRPILRVRALTHEEQGRLRRLAGKGRDARVVRRVQVIRLSARGLAPHRIAELLDRSWSGVRKTINRFNREGLVSLSDRPRRGRPRKADDRYVALLKEAVRASPRDLGYVFSAWTLDRLREHLALKTRVILSHARLSTLMRENRIVYRRPKHGMSHLRDPAEYDQKKALLAFLKKGRRDRPPETPASISCTSMSVRFTSTRP